MPVAPTSMKAADIKRLADQMTAGAKGNLVEQVAVVVEREQPAVGDGDTMSVAREIAQYFCGALPWRSARRDQK